MLNKTKMIFGLSIVTLVAAASTGCMTSHGSGENVGDVDKVQRFHGWSNVPNQKVRVYAQRGFDDWVLVGEGRSGSSGYNYWGVNWYFWYVHEIVPRSCWHSISGPGTNGDYMAVLKVVDENGDLLYMWEKDFYNYYDDYSSFSELWSEKGAGQGYVIINGDE